MILTRKNWSSGRESFPSVICQPKIPYDLASYRTRNSALLYGCSSHNHSPLHTDSTLCLKLFSFRCGAVEVFAVRGCRAASRCSSSPTFRESLLLPFRGSKFYAHSWLSWLWRLVTIFCFETSVMSYNVTAQHLRHFKIWRRLKRVFWALRSYGAWRRVAGLVFPDVSTNLSALFFTGWWILNT